MGVKELNNLFDLGQAKLETHLQKKGYRRSSFDMNDPCTCYTKEEKGKSPIIHCFQISHRDDYQLSFETTSAREDSILKKEIIAMGFNYVPTAEPILYQKQNIRIESATKKVDSLLFYVLKFSKKELPRKKDIAGAEDLLQLDAHEYLVTLFGNENVKTDLFYFTETEANKCSVIFPNTSSEAIFVWNDELHMKDLAFIVIGGSLRPKEHTGNVNQVAHNIWGSKQGIYCGMSLKEVESLNAAPIRFYNWQTESAGYLAPNNKGSIDFTKLGIVFNCLNCSFVKTTNAQITESASALEENQKVYVTTLIILPEKKNVEAHALR